MFAHKKKANISKVIFDVSLTTEISNGRTEMEKYQMSNEPPDPKQQMLKRKTTTAGSKPKNYTRLAEARLTTKDIPGN